MLQDLILPVAIVGGLGAFFGIGLTIASKKFEVKVDELFVKVREALPGVNCGACGQTGCDSFAQVLIRGEATIDGCPVGGAKLAKELSEILEVEEIEVKPKKAFVKCEGSFDKCSTKYEYVGKKSCAAAAEFYNGPVSCSYSCIAMGDCVRECQFDAITVENGVAKVDPNKCTSCGKCVKVCPNEIIEMIPEGSQYMVSCSSQDKGAIVRKHCTVGCIGCTKCVKTCPVEAIEMIGPLAKIDGEKCTNCGECIKVCPAKTINKRI